MKKTMLAVVMSVVAATLWGADAPTWTCSLKVETPKLESKRSESDGGRNNSTKTKNCTMLYPVKVSFSGKEIPTTGISVKSTFIGSRDKTPTILGETTTEVKLEKNVFKTTIKSPVATMTETMRRQGRRTITESSGERITGAIMQLMVDGKVVKCWASKPGWKKLAKADTLDTEAVLKIR